MTNPRRNLRAYPIILEVKSRWRFSYLRELWEYRDLLFFLVWRDISVRYKQTILGITWAVLQPFFQMVVFTVFFGQLARIPSDGIPYPLFSFAGLLPWQFFANAVSNASGSLVANSALLSKVYFPRVIIPLASALSGIADFGFAFLMLLALMAFYGTPLTVNLLLLPGLLLLALCTALGLSLWLSALNVRYRDFRYIIPFMLQFLLFASPVIYPSSLLPSPLRLIYALNPMAGVVEGFRWALLGATAPVGPLLILSSLVVIVLMITGLIYFYQTERVFADIV